ncbi:precorrin-4 C(11)-methyltransferase [Thermosulfuriphilus ammonigenes]|nr:precorrin-4 C(11)-methyltransferase [Thermosulfuriphilus ammonigenes]
MRLMGEVLNKAKVYLVGAGPGDPELLTIKARRLLEEADLIVFAGSLVPQEILSGLKGELVNSASLSLPEIISLLSKAAKEGKKVIRLHSGDPSLFGAIAEEMEELEKQGVACEVVPGVSSFLAAAAALGCELTVPEVSQTLIITRASGRTPVPEKESLKELSAHQATMVLFLSASLIDKVTKELIEGGYPPETPAACVYRVGWPEEKIIRAPLKELARAVKEADIRKQALIFVGQVLEPPSGKRSKLYDPAFTHGFRQPKE